MSPRAFVVGHPVAHSRSPMLHGHWLQTLGIGGSYERVDVAPEELRGFFDRVRTGEFVGGNVTVPHKVTSIAHLARLEPAAAAIGAVNTVWREGSALVGGNTDAAGFAAHLDEQAPGWETAGPAVVLGAGGAARAVAYALRQRGVGFRIVNRTRATAEALAARLTGEVAVHDWSELPAVLAGAGLLVNTTALGMQGQPPLALDLARLPRDAVVYDIVYTPLETHLLAAARTHGLRAVDGLGMLLHQAVPGFSRWFGVTPAVTPELRGLIERDLAV